MIFGGELRFLIVAKRQLSGLSIVRLLRRYYLQHDLLSL